MIIFLTSSHLVIVIIGIRFNMLRLPTIFQNKNHDLAKSAQAQWAGDIANALNRARVRRHAVKMQQEAGKIDGDDAASRNLCGRIKLLDEVRAILDEVPVEERYHEWMEQDGWVREQKRLVASLADVS